MWQHKDMEALFPIFEDFDLVATTIQTVYNEAAESAGLYARMRKCPKPSKSMRIRHDWAAPPKPGEQLTDRAKRSQQFREQGGKRPKEAASASR